MILEKIKPYLEPEGIASLTECLDFFRSKAAKAERQILKAIDNSDEETIRAINGQNWTSKRYLKVLWGFDGAWDNLFRLNYYDGKPLYFDRDYRNYLSVQNFDQYKKQLLAKGKKHVKDKDYVSAYYAFQVVHEIDPILKHCVKPLLDDGESGVFEFDPKKPLTISGAHKATNFCLQHGLYERARSCIDTLKNYMAMPVRTRAGYAYKPEVYAPIVEYYDQLLLARQSRDRKKALRHAARAAVAYFRMVIVNYKNKDAQATFGCEDPRLSLYVISEFDFDPEWARNYLRNDFVGATDYHNAFFKAVQLGAWARHPNELNLLPPPEASKIIEKIRAEMMDALT